MRELDGPVTQVGGLIPSASTAITAACIVPESMRAIIAEVYPTAADEVCLLKGRSRVFRLPAECDFNFVRMYRRRTLGVAVVERV